jgi:hypothetical protein
MSRLRRLLVAGCLSALAACGDGTFIIAFNSGIIAGPPQCSGGGGQFPLQQSGGLEVLVVITDNTSIVVAGFGGSCTDLAAGQAVEVAGRDSGDRIVATSITVR